MITKKVLLLLLIISFSSCGIRTRYLRKDSGKVPVKGYKYVNKKHFTDSLFNDISTNNLYRIVDSYYCDKNLKKVEGRKYYFSNWIVLLQFYNNGCVRRFPEKFSTPDPEVEGNRGIVYKKKEQIYIDICEAISNNVMVINTYRVYVREDKLLLVRTDDGSLFEPPVCYVYQKSDAIPNDWLKYNADW